MIIEAVCKSHIAENNWCVVVLKKMQYFMIEVYDGLCCKTVGVSGIWVK